MSGTRAIGQLPRHGSNLRRKGVLCAVYCVLEEGVTGLLAVMLYIISNLRSVAIMGGSACVHR